MTDIVKESEEYARSEIEKYGAPSIINFEVSKEKGIEIAKKLGADLEIVKIGLNLMDLKLGEAKSLGKIKEHIAMSVEASKTFLSKFNLPKEKTDKILNCVEGHHGTKKWICKEAEICANADCYRFLSLKNWLFTLIELNDLKLLEEKAEEKWRVLSLDICKKELESDYKLIKEIIRRAK